MTSLNDLPIRADLLGDIPYGAPQLEIPVQLNVNENTHGVPAEVQARILERLKLSLETINRYPDREFMELREALAIFMGHELTAQQLWAANGSNEILQQIHQAFGGPGRTALSFGPTYSMYPIIAKSTLTEYLELPRESGYELTPDYVARNIRAQLPDIVLLCSPNNPTGNPISLETVEAAYEATQGIVVVDEAYAEFSSIASAASLLRDRPRLLISRTMSKAFAFAGARVGYLAADPAVVDALRLVRLPYHLSGLTQAAALAAIESAPLMLSEVAEIKNQRELLFEQLLSLGLKPLPSDSNFLLVTGFPDADACFEHLLADGVIVRKTSIDGSLRITVGTSRENSILIGSMQSHLAG